ncbi:MAG: hypothetical protein FJ087_04475 [Deltaproteobacteria bacterium]|nr:hypothetical protein [Deltaproteobacteria bacterium]
MAASKLRGHAVVSMSSTTVRPLVPMMRRKCGSVWTRLISSAVARRPSSIAGDRLRMSLDIIRSSSTCKRFGVSG